MKAKTVGFAMSDKDLELLDRLSDHYGNGNRSEFLRLAMKRMERDRIAASLRETRAAIAVALQGRQLSEQEAVDLCTQVAQQGD
jgi:metal-responsive CopG/Arc/MetJ family transcriptional regulator